MGAVRTSLAQETLAFGPLIIAFDDRVLRPRPWTIAQSVWAIELCRRGDPHRALEMCPGAGQIGLLALSMLPHADLVSIDVDPVACDYVRVNAADAGLKNRVDAREARIEDALHDDEMFDVIIADPPWVPHREAGMYPAAPMLAIDGGEHGLSVVWSCLDTADRHLARGGAMVLQVGTTSQVDAVRQRLAHTAAGLHVREARPGPRGCLVRLERLP